MTTFKTVLCDFCGTPFPGSEGQKYCGKVHRGYANQLNWLQAMQKRLREENESKPVGV